MDRALTVERLYYLGDYKNIKFTNSLTDIPENLAKNDKVTSLLFFQNALACEIAYRKYLETIEIMVREKNDPIPYLEEKREQTLAQLLEEINKVSNEKGE
jgi:hypothetical protein